MDEQAHKTAQGLRPSLRRGPGGSFLKVYSRGGDSVSSKVINWIWDYMAAHRQGNLQTLLDFAGYPKDAAPLEDLQIRRPEPSQRTVHLQTGQLAKDTPKLHTTKQEPESTGQPLLLAQRRERRRR